MCIIEKSKYIVIKVPNDWSNFSFEHNGKEVALKGFDGKTNDWYSDDPEIVQLMYFEQHWNDLCHHELFSEASDEDGNRFIIIKRLQNQ